MSTVSFDISYWKGIGSMAKAAAKKKPPSKTEVFTSIAEKTELTRKQVELKSAEVKARPLANRAASSESAR